VNIDLEKLRTIGALTRSDPKEWTRDMAAYKRLRDQGLQPKHVDGSAKLEAQASDRFEIEMGHLVEKPSDRRAIEDAIDRGREIQMEGM
jgi:hypothetical protein